MINEANVVKKVLKGVEKNNPQDMKVEDAFDLDDPKKASVTESKLNPGGVDGASRLINASSGLDD